MPNLKPQNSGSVCKTYYAISAFVTATIVNTRSNHNLNDKRSTRVQKGIRRKSGTVLYLKHFRKIVFGYHHSTDFWNI